MPPVRNPFDAIESAPGSAPLGWRVSMRLCNLLIAATILGFAAIMAIQFGALRLL